MQRESRASNDLHEVAEAAEEVDVKEASGVTSTTTSKFKSSSTKPNPEGMAKLRYSKEQLMVLKNNPLSKKTPDFFNVEEVSSLIIWDPDQKKSSTPPENSASRSEQQENRKRVNDPRERLRKENDGIVLSPQRRSFNSGCFVPVREASRLSKTHSPLSKNDLSGRDLPAGVRRIGSGRILRDNWDFTEKPDNETEIHFRNSMRDDRRCGRDLEITRDKEKDRHSMRYNERRRISNEKNEEPEWFSSGPMSQHDTIELRGFDETDKLGTKKKLSASQAKRVREWARKKGDFSNSISEEEISHAHKERKTSASHETRKEDLRKSNNQKGGGNNSGDKDENKKDGSFNFDEILKSDAFPDLLTNGVSAAGDSTKSRFSHWFNRESPKKSNSPHGKEQENHLLKSILKDINETNVAIPSDPELYFAPISPAANTLAGGAAVPPPPPPQSHTGKPMTLLEMLQKVKPPNHGRIESVPPPKLACMGKMMYSDEIEAKMRTLSNADVAAQQKSQAKQEDAMTEFKRLLAQATGPQRLPTNTSVPPPSKPMSLMEMLSHSQQQDEAQQIRINQPPVQNPVDMNNPYKMQQMQMHLQHIEKMEKVPDFMPVPPHMPAQTNAQIREVINRPDAQALLQGMKRGEITPQHIYQQLANPNVQPRHREMLNAVLRLQGGQLNAGILPPSRILSPVPPPHHFFQQVNPQLQQHLRVSPLPPAAMHQRIPSPRELQVHTQNILQQALIKKKLEEQNENYRKRQQMQQPRIQSPATTKSVSSPTPLAFTPTSVLRKMTADKEEGSKENKTGLKTNKVPQGRAVTGMKMQPIQTPQMQPQQPPPPQRVHQYVPKQPGRPIVKANTSYQVPDQFYNMQHQPHQQRVFNQPPQQNRKMPPPQGDHTYKMSGQNAGNPPQYSSNNQLQQLPQLTQQQLRAQHQQQAGPTNQLMPHLQQAPASQVYQPQPQGPPPQSQQQQNTTWQEFFNNATQQHNKSQREVGSGDGDLSPSTSNQLARWFSHDLLQRARGGELPSTAGLAQHALSLEEIERQTAPPVHN